MSREFALAAGTFALALVIGLSVMPMLGDPTPAAHAESTPQRAPPLGLRGRDASRTASIHIVDGDTLIDTMTDTTYRVVNIDTPETGDRAHCAAERALGDRATRQAGVLVRNAATFDIRPTGRIDTYGRTIAYVVIDGRDFGEAMIADGLARPWRGRRQPWCDRHGNLIP